jgi:hypothetical protein
VSDALGYTFERWDGSVARSIKADDALASAEQDTTLDEVLLDVDHEKSVSHAFIGWMPSVNIAGAP